MQRLAGFRQTTKIYEYQFIIRGILPTVNNIGYHENDAKKSVSWGGIGINPPTCIFKGLKRPLSNKGEDSKIYAYVYNPPCTYEYLPDMVCCAKLVNAPKRCVFIIYTRFNDCCSSGEILSWEWVTSEDQNVPDNAIERYEEQVWRK